MRTVKRLITAAVSAAVVFTAAAGMASAAADTDTAAALLISEEKQAVYDSLQDAACEVRKDMAERQVKFTLSFPFGLVSGKGDVFDLINAALEETDSPYEGDYIRFSIYQIAFQISSSYSAMKTDVDFTVTYNTDASQEKAVDTAVAAISEELGMSRLNDYEKCAAVCEWVRNNVVYAQNTSDMITHTAYGAVIDHNSVCQGTSLLVYRILRENGVNCRIVPGRGNSGSHAWNAASIDGKWYYIDATWDGMSLSSDEFAFFLRGRNDFDESGFGNTHDPDYVYNPDSVLNFIYTDGTFNAECPVENYRYAPLSPGDTDTDGEISSKDASLVLKAYAGLATASGTGLTNAQSQAADIFHKCSIDANCASAILSYYGYISTGGELPLNKFINR